MHNQKFLKLRFLLLTLVLFLSACSGNSGKSLPLENYHSPDGRFEFAIPSGWQTRQDGALLVTMPADYSDTEEELIVHLYASPTGTTDTATHINLAKEQIEPFLETVIGEDYETVNEGETRVDKYPAMLLDFAKPHGETYMLGRVVIVAMPFYVLVFVGTGIEAEWEAFLPTFREMLGEFHLSSAESPEGQPLPYPGN
jgi:hypothetical protein